MLSLLMQCWFGVLLVTRCLVNLIRGNTRRKKKEERRKRKKKKKKKEEKRRNKEERRKKSAAYEADGLQGVPMIHASPPARGGARSAFTQVQTHAGGGGVGAQNR